VNYGESNCGARKNAAASSRAGSFRLHASIPSVGRSDLGRGLWGDIDIAKIDVDSDSDSVDSVSASEVE
jgi:hypothetical protein